MARKTKGKDQEAMKLFYLFYTRERWDNWLATLREMNMEVDPESEDMPEIYQTLSNFRDDITVSVLKIIKLYQNERFTKEETLQKLDEVEEIVMGEIPESDITDIISDLQFELLVLFLSCKKFIKGPLKGDIKELVKDGRNIGEENIEKSLEIAGTIGALVIDGGSCCGKYLRADVESTFDAWLDEIDAMGNALKTLKKFDEEPGEAH
jgi:hypothetical protein